MRAGADPHADIEVVERGVPLEEADGAVVGLHGRGATARGFVDLAVAAHETGAIAHLAPQAAGNTWYPRSFLEPTDRNEPHLSSALAAVGRLVRRACEAVGSDAVLVLGFSQGGCLASEFVARQPARYGGLVAFSGGLVGDRVDPARYGNSLAGTPVYLGCSDVDPHIPLERVHETASTLEAIGGEVTTEIFEGMGHTVNERELTTLRAMIDALV